MLRKQVMVQKQIFEIFIPSTFQILPCERRSRDPCATERQVEKLSHMSGPSGMCLSIYLSINICDTKISYLHYIIDNSTSEVCFFTCEKLFNQIRRYVNFSLTTNIYQCIFFVHIQEHLNIYTSKDWRLSLRIRQSVLYFAARFV